MSNTTRTRLGVTIVVVALLFAGSAAAFRPPTLPGLPPSATASAPFQPAATIYQEDFELGDGGYVASGNAGWEYGVAASPPETLPGQGPNVWGTVLAGDYANSTCGALTSAPIDLSAFPPGAATGASAARLAFSHWMHVENRFDAGLVQASADGVSWQTLTPVGGYPAIPLTTARACLGLDATGRAFTTPSTPVPDATAWRIAEFDVTSFLGGMMHVRWMFASDSLVAKRGWYLDDVIVQLGAGASATVPLPDTSAPSVPFNPVRTVYAEDFEITDGGWTGTGSWSWGSPHAPPVTSPGSLNVWGAGLLGPYASNECSAVTSPEIAIPGAAGPGAHLAQLSFKLWRHLENGYDGAQVEASVDGGATWLRLTPSAGYDRALTSSLAAATRTCLGITTSHTTWSGPSSAPRDDEWKDVQVDVTPLMGANAMFRIVLGSESSGEQRGVFLDDVLLQIGAGASTSGIDLARPPVPTPTWAVEGSNPSWQYGWPMVGPESDPPAWATNLRGNYGPNECAAVTSSPIDTNVVPGVGRLELQFQHVFETAHTLDGGAIQVSRDDGATWTTLVPVGGYNSVLTGEARDCIYGGDLASPGWSGVVAANWKDVKASLQGYLGETIRLRFLFGTSASSHDPGWAVRNIVLTRGLASVPLTASAADAQLALDKADPALRDALRDGATDDLRVIVTGKGHMGVADLGLTTREEYAAWFDREGGPVVAAMRDVVQRVGGEELAAWTMLPGLAATLDLQGILALGGMDEVESVALDRDDAVRLVEPMPDDSVGATNTQGRQMLQAEDIWALGYKGAGVTISVIDTGIDPTHEAFKYADGSSRVAAWVDWTQGLTVPYDNHGHGTHVAGSSVGSALYDDPTFGYYQETGVAPEATLTVSKFLDGGGGGSFANAINSLNWSFHVAQADITSNSWGSSCGTSSVGVMQMVRTTTDAGMLNVFAAGNSGPGSSTIGGPACSESALSVGAIDGNMNIAAFSSRGPCSDIETGGSPRICPDVVAKGVAVRSAIPRSGAGYADPTGYRSWQGTSMATPLISGAVALAEQMKRDLTGTGWDTAARAEEEVFKLTALDLGTQGPDNTFGWGLPQLLNIYAMLASTDEVNLVTTFGVSRPIVRQGDTTTLSFGVRNLGGAIASGLFEATLESPSGAMSVLRSENVALGLLDGASSTTSFAVTGSVPPGTYTFRGSFAYSWNDPNTGDVVTGLIAREGTFDVKRVFVEVEMEGLDARTTPGDLQLVRYRATNTGNEDARNVTIELTVRDDYVFVPGTNFDPLDDRTRYADPTPSDVVEDRNFGRVTLVFDVGDLPQGGTFEFTTQLLPTTPGTYPFLSVARWADGAGTKFSQGSVTTQVVAAP